MKNFTLIILGIFTFLACEKSENSGFDSANSGKGGSMARFTIANNYLYTVDNQKLNVFDISNSQKPVLKKNMQAGFNIETIFVNKNTLFMGSEWGMYIFDISQPENPTSLSFFQHIYSCDPVVANDTLAYLTMRTESFCGRNTNELQVIDIKDRTLPKFVTSVAMTQPRGLGIEGKLLFVCDDGLKLFSLDNPLNPVFKKKFNIPAIDVIPDNNVLMVLATDGLHQYKFENDTIQYLSHLQ